MIDKSVDGRQPTAADVARELAEWLASRGQSFISSGDSGGSSANLAAAAGTAARLAAGAAGSPGPRAAAAPPKRQRTKTTADTVDDSDQLTFKGPTAPSREPAAPAAARRPQAAAGAFPKPAPISDDPSAVIIDTGDAAGPGRQTMAVTQRVAKKRGKDPPVWIWVLVVAGAVAALGLLLALLVQFA